MRKIIGLIILVVMISGCSLVLDDSNESLDQVGYGIMLVNNQGCGDIASSGGALYSFDFPGNYISIDESTRFRLESSGISIEDDTQFLNIDTVLFLRRNEDVPGLCSGVVVQTKEKTREFRSNQQTGIGFGEPGGAIIRQFTDVLDADGNRSNINLRVNLQYADPLESIEVLFYDNNNQLIDRKDGFTLDTIDLKSGYIVIEIMRVAYDGETTIERDIYSSNDRRFWGFERFTYPYFENDEDVARLKSITINMEDPQ